jgi:predicted phosphodiesterase
MTRRDSIKNLGLITIGSSLLPTTESYAREQSKGNYRKIAVLADVHGNSWALEAVLEDIQKRNVSEIINLGDIFYGPLNPSETFKLLSKNKMTTIGGNTDRYLMEVTLAKIEKPTIPLTHPTMNFVIQSLGDTELRWTKELTHTYSLDPHLYLCHGNPLTDDLPLVEQITATGVSLSNDNELNNSISNISQNIILCAHTHIGRFHQIENGKAVINPGSVGMPAYTNAVPFPHKMESQSPFAKYCIIELEGETLLTVQHINVKYNWEMAIAQAQKNNRPDWARWLRFGKD